MSLHGAAVIAIWQDLAPEAKANFYEWHNRQHVPERLSIPGFHRARRFVAIDGGPEFYTLYETENLEAAGGKAYLDRLNSPTEWTRRIMPAFRNMARSVCRVVFSSGTGEGGYMMTLRFSLGEGDGAVKQICQRVLPSLVDQTGIVGVHLCLADGSTSSVPTFEKTFRTAQDVVPPCVAMIEGSSRGHVRAAGDVLIRAIKDTTGGSAEVALYQVEHSSSSGPGSQSSAEAPRLEHAPA